MQFLSLITLLVSICQLYVSALLALHLNLKVYSHSIKKFIGKDSLIGKGKTYNKRGSWTLIQVLAYPYDFS